MNTISKDLDIDKNIRGFEFSESSRHLSNQIEKSDVDSLVQTATNNFQKSVTDIINIKQDLWGKNLIIGIEMLLIPIRKK